MAENCCCCGKTLDEKEQGSVTLKDGSRVCKDCADKTRILYPLRYVKEVAKSDIASSYYKGKSYYDDFIGGRRIDPLKEMTAEEFRAAMEESLKAAEKQAALYAGAKAVIEADHVRKYYVNVGSSEKPKYNRRKVYGVFGKVIHGELITGAEVRVSHRDKDYCAKTTELQDWDGTSIAGQVIGKASAGSMVIMMFSQEMDFVYPGDTLTVRE